MFLVSTQRINLAFSKDMRLFGLYPNITVIRKSFTFTLYRVAIAIPTKTTCIFAKKMRGAKNSTPQSVALGDKRALIPINQSQNCHLDVSCFEQTMLAGQNQMPPELAHHLESQIDRHYQNPPRCHFDCRTTHHSQNRRQFSPC